MTIDVYVDSDVKVTLHNVVTASVDDGVFTVKDRDDNVGAQFKVWRYWTATSNMDE